MKKYLFILSVFIFYMLFNMVLFPSVFIKASLDGITAWALNVLPSILPFVFFTKILSSIGATEKISRVFKKPAKSLFNTPALSSYTFFASIISGYPVGAKLTADLYEQGKIKKSDAFKMTSFCSTSGPMFIIGAVGVGLLKNAFVGYLIFTAHILGALTNGLIYRNLKVKKDDFLINTHLDKQNSHNDLSNIVLDSALSLISVGVIITIFFVVITAFMPLINLFPASLSGIISGLIEITKGCQDISFTLTGLFSTLATTFVISFGGISTALQSMTMLNKLKMPIWLFLLQKITHAVCATFIALILYLSFF